MPHACNLGEQRLQPERLIILERPKLSLSVHHPSEVHGHGMPAQGPSSRQLFTKD